MYELNFYDLSVWSLKFDIFLKFGDNSNSYYPGGGFLFSLNKLSLLEYTLLII
jgi:hypothetical protein